VHKKLPMRELADKCGCSITPIHIHLIKFGIERRNGHNPKRIWLDKEELHDLYIEQCISPYKIADMMNVSSLTIYNELKRHQIPIRGRSESKLGDKNPMFGVKQSAETIEKRISKLRGRACSEETKRKISVKNSGENNGQWKGIPFMKICETCGIEFRRNNGNINQRFCSIKCARQGEYNSAWKDGASFEPYCPKFNFEMKEKIRNRDNRVCVLCGKSEIENGQRLSVHHIDGDKMQGCNGKKWYLSSLCKSCNSKRDTIEKEFLIVSKTIGF